MTIQEAINSGKRFKRPCFTYFISRDSVGGLMFENLEDYTPSVASLLASDWEVEPLKKKLIGADDIHAAVTVALTGGHPLEFRDRLIKELGLEE